MRSLYSVAPGAPLHSPRITWRMDAGHPHPAPHIGRGFGGCIPRSHGLLCSTHCTCPIRIPAVKPVWPPGGAILRSSCRAHLPPPCLRSAVGSSPLALSSCSLSYPLFRPPLLLLRFIRYFGICMFPFLEIVFVGCFPLKVAGLQPATCHCSSAVADVPLYYSRRVSRFFATRIA